MKAQNEWKKHFEVAAERASREAKDFQLKMKLFQAFYPAASAFMILASVLLALTYYRVLGFYESHATLHPA